MLPNKPQDYPNSFPARVWYTHLIEEIGDEAIEKLGFYPNERLLDTTKEVAKIAKSDLEQLLYEGILYQEFFELQILVKKDSIEWLKNNATKNEVLSHHGFNNMLGYKYFLKRIRDGLMFSNQPLENGYD